MEQRADRRRPMLWLRVGAIDDHAAEHELSAIAIAVYRLLIEHADRRTGVLRPITLAELAALARAANKSTRRALNDLEAAGLAEVKLRRGHAGEIVLTRHSEVVLTSARAPHPRLFRPTTLMQRISRWLAATGDWHTANDIRRMVPGNTDGKRAALAALVAEGHVEIREDGQRRLHRHVCPFTLDVDDVVNR